MEEFDQAAADLEKAIAADEAGKDLMKSEEVQALLKDPAKVKEALALGVQALAKAKGAIKTDLSQEEAVKDKETTDTEDDPAESPKPSGRGYKDTRPYTGKHTRKGDDDHDDDDDGDDGKDKKKPSFFGKMAKKGKKAHKGDDEADADVDATEFMETLGKAMDHVIGELHELRAENALLKAEVEEVKEGSVIFGQVLADPRRDNALSTMLKALTSIHGGVEALKKAVAESGEGTNSLLKSIAAMPGAPRAVGMALVKSGDLDPTGAGARSDKVSEGDKGRLMKARVSKQITEAEWQHAVRSGDVSILEKVK